MNTGRDDCPYKAECDAKGEHVAPGCPQPASPAAVDVLGKIATALETLDMNIGDASGSDTGTLSWVQERVQRIARFTWDARAKAAIEAEESLAERMLRLADELDFLPDTDASDLSDEQQGEEYAYSDAAARIRATVKGEQDA